MMSAGKMVTVQRLGNSNIYMSMYTHFHSKACLLTSRLSFMTGISMAEVLSALTPIAPHFPLAEPPKCRHCGWKPHFRNTVGGNNPNGNAGRLFYKCWRCENRGRDDLNYDESSAWIAWTDDRGIHPANPHCDCGVASRQDRAGVRSGRPGWGFWTCASGACWYYSEFRNGLTWSEPAKDAEDSFARVNFVPWLI